ncbi:membrane cofactor protein-like isoform X1 [Xiphophorus couchianus]|uniref:membrane cofactor protein-like isoform X1 n=1 Tax=Xiphophorus couchianus TaxID=32473 RepID=UPI0010162BB7|nr:membrane cofactor protein-like isoform X1 [Xiphophorus couchianus]
MKAKKGFFVVGLLYWNLTMSVSALFLLGSLCLACSGCVPVHIENRKPCSWKSCGSLGEVTNGQVSYPEGVQFGDKALITCNIGHILVGKSEIKCEIQGWSARLPTCEVVKCLQPSSIANGTFVPLKEDYAYRDVVEYSCNKGYTLNGSRQLICEENEKFKPSPPSCVWVECKDPVIPNAEYIDGSRPPHRHMATVIYNCKPGYKMIGQNTLTCNISSQWYPRIPECISNGNVVVGGLLGGLAPGIMSCFRACCHSEYK